MATEKISKAIQKYMTNQPSKIIIGAATTPTTIFNYATFSKDVKDRYLDKGDPHILITGATMKYFNTRIPEPSYPNVNIMMTQECHLDLPVTGYHIFTRYGTSL